MTAACQALFGALLAILAQGVPENERDLYALGRALAEEGRIEEAKEAYQKAKESSPASPWPHYGLAEILWKENRPNKAIEVVNRAIELARDDPAGLPTFLLFRSVILYSRGHLREAKADLLAVLEKSGPNADAHYQLALIYLKEGNFKETMAQGMAMVRTGERLDEAHYLIGQALFKKGKLPDAKKVLQKAIELNPGSVEAHHTLAQVLVRLGEREEAEREMEIYSALQRIREDVDRLLGSSPLEMDMSSWRQLSVLYGELGRFEDAKVYAEKVLRAEPEDREGLFILGHIQAELEDISGAMQVFRKCIKLHPDYYPPYNNLALILATVESVRDPGEAVRLAEKAKDLGSPLVGTLAEAYFSRGEVEEASRLLEAAIEEGHEMASIYREQLERIRKSGSARRPQVPEKTQDAIGK